MKTQRPPIAIPSARPVLFAALGVLAASPSAAAQFNDEWVGFNKENHRLVVASELGTNDTQERVYVVGDVNRNGWTDVIIVRKEPFSTSGRRRNVLLMNEGGVLVDRTVQYAAQSTVPGDEGFLTPTNDRDAVLTDVDGDGWLDLVTSTTLSPGQPKHISHPRVYMNLGNDAQGNWQGFRHEDHRFPQLLLSNGNPSWPRFCAVAAGDLTGNGLPDLYFADYDRGLEGQGGDMNDRLLINDGTGVFVDESTLRMQQSWLNSNFGAAAEIADMNGNGLMDVMMVDTLFGSGVTITYNDPNNPGFFNLNQAVYVGSPYFASVGDLNRDGRLDLVITDDGDDRYKLNQGNDAFGRAVFGPSHAFQFVSGSDGVFGGDNMIADLDNDGWPDVIITDVDADIPGCSRRAKIYHNRGGTVGGFVTLREEAGTSGWRGAVGILPDDLIGTFHVAILDIDNNGYLDLVIGRCTGTAVWMNTLGEAGPPGLAYCSCDGSGSAPPCANSAGAGQGCVNSSGQGAALVGGGSSSASGDGLTLSVSGLPPSQPAMLFVGTQALNGGAGVPFGDGLLCAGGSVIRFAARVADSLGNASWGPGLGATGGWSAGQTRRFQTWYRDPVGGPCGNGTNLTNGYQMTFSP